MPILYQARYREQEAHKILNEIELLISQIERNESTVSPSVMTPGIDIEQKLLKEFIPNMLYCIKEPSQFKEAEEQFRDFMRGYRFKEDVDAIVTLIGSKEQLGAQDYRLLELYAKKIAAVKKEDFSAAEVYSKEIQSLRSE